MLAGADAVRLGRDLEALPFCAVLSRVEDVKVDRRGEPTCGGRTTNCGGQAAAGPRCAPRRRSPGTARDAPTDSGDFPDRPGELDRPSEQKGLLKVTVALTLWIYPNRLTLAESRWKASLPRRLSGWVNCCSILTRLSLSSKEFEKRRWRALPESRLPEFG